MFLVNYNCFMKCIEKNVVNYSYFGNSPRTTRLALQVLRVSQLFVCASVMNKEFSVD